MMDYLVETKSPNRHYSLRDQSRQRWDSVYAGFRDDEEGGTFANGTFRYAVMGFQK